ncbi:hypothetical protein [Streptomyces inusitatus]|uniref:hypothetical protein n=1 Tax=Streptomyces inusitatus TaxID=68221 RepID=UPI0027E3B771|nr:hypothetical protein [Streptomyces inusitatus]
MAAESVDRTVQCQLSAHNDGDHHGFLAELDEYATALWLRWQERTEVDLVVLSDCPVVTPGPDKRGLLSVRRPHHGTFLATRPDSRGGAQIRHFRPPLNESCGNCGTHNDLGEI